VRRWHGCRAAVFRQLGHAIACVVLPWAYVPALCRNMPGRGGGSSSSSADVTSGCTIGEAFAKFQSEHALNKVVQPRTNLEWAYYQAGPASAASEALLFIHGTSGTAAAFFYQVQALAEKGYRVLSAQYPAYDSPQEWCKGFDHFLDAVKFRSVHVFGAGLGGFLVQHFAAAYPHRLRSLLLCNAYATTNPFAEKAGPLTSVVHFSPTPLLRKVVLDMFPEGGMELSAQQAINFIAHQVHGISGDDLASRLSLNSTASSVGPLRLEQGRITLMESNGETMVPDELRRQLRQLYPGARLAQLKAGGDFPYLSRPDEATLFVEVHMRGVGVYPHGATPGPGDLPAGRELPFAAPALAEASASYTAGLEPSVGVWRDEPHVDARSTRREQWTNPFEDDLL